MPFPVLPVVALGLGALALYSLVKKPEAKTPEVVPWPYPVPKPPGPSPTPDLDFLRSQLLSQLQGAATLAAANPNSVDPNAVDALAVKLDAAGLPLQAQAARNLATEIRVKRGQTPIPPPGPGPVPPLPPDVLTASYNALMAQAAIAPSMVNPDNMDYVASQLEMAGRVGEASNLRAAAKAARAAQKLPPVATAGTRYGWG
jgi:hypothetical protein